MHAQNFYFVPGKISPCTKFKIGTKITVEGNKKVTDLVRNSDHAEYESIADLICDNPIDIMRVNQVKGHKTFEEKKIAH
jgi:hypothetical protein